MFGDSLHAGPRSLRPATLLLAIAASFATGSYAAPIKFSAAPFNILENTNGLVSVTVTNTYDRPLTILKIFPVAAAKDIVFLSGDKDDQVFKATIPAGACMNALLPVGAFCQFNMKVFTQDTVMAGPPDKGNWEIRLFADVNRGDGVPVVFAGIVKGSVLDPVTAPEPGCAFLMGAGLLAISFATRFSLRKLGMDSGRGSAFRKAR